MSMRSNRQGTLRLRRGAAGLTLIAIFWTGCAVQPIADPIGVVAGEQRRCGGPVLDCRGYFSQAQRQFQASISTLAPTGGGIGLGVGASSSQLIALDSISGDMIIHYQRYCQQYNACLISQEEFLRRTDTLQATQTAVRSMVGGLPTPGYAPVSPIPSFPQAPSFPSAPETYPDGTTKPMRIAESIFRVILEAMRPAPGAIVPPSPPLVSPPPVPLPPSAPAVVAPTPPVFSPPPRSGAATRPDVDEPFKAIVSELAQVVRPQGPSTVRAVLGEINYRDTEFGSPLSVFLKRRLHEHLSRSGVFVLLDAPRLQAIGGVDKPKSATALAEATGADVILSGNYWDTPEGVELFVSARHRQDGILLGVARAVLPPTLLPPDTPVAPANLATARLNERIEDRIAPRSGTQTASPLKVEVWTDRGRGAIYAEGDEVRVMVRVSEDAYLRLYYTDPNNETHQIFPNRYRTGSWVRGGSMVTIPAPEDRFVFRVKGPFGVGSVTAIASRKPLVDPGWESVSAGPFRQVSGGIRGLEALSRSAGDGDIVRDRVVLTTVSKTQ